MPDAGGRPGCWGPARPALPAAASVSGPRGQALLPSLQEMEMFLKLFTSQLLLLCKSIRA